MFISPVVTLYRLVFNFQKNGKRTRMPLVMCETENAGLLREAAKRVKGFLSVKILDKDCVAIEVRYRQKCYKNYANFLYRKNNSLAQNHPFYTKLACAQT